MLARISSALFVHMNGFGVAWCAAMNSRIAVLSCATLRWTPRRSSLFVSSANQRSTRLSHDPCGGEVDVKPWTLREPVADQRGFMGAVGRHARVSPRARGLTGEATPEGSTESALQTSLSST